MEAESRVENGSMGLTNWLENLGDQLGQGFSTWGTWAPGGMQKFPGVKKKGPGYANFIIGGMQIMILGGCGLWKLASKFKFSSSIM